jgi:DNA-binding transcriptional LysR family regulator
MVTVSPQGRASFDDPELVIQAVEAGLGIGSCIEEPLARQISSGHLVQVLKDWCPVFPGYFLYYPSRRNQPAALSALVNTLRSLD